MGLMNSHTRKIEIVFRDGMLAKWCIQDIRCNKVSIEKLREFGDGRTYSRVGIMSSQNGRQNKDWIWIVNQTLTVEHYIQACSIEPFDNVTVAFFI